MAVIASINHGGSLWDTQKNERLYNWNHKSGDYSDLVLTAISESGHVAMTADTKNIVAWNTQSGKSQGFWTAPSRLHSLAIHPNGQVAALGREDNLTSIMSLRSGQINRSLVHEHTIRSVNFIPNTDYLLTGSEDMTANVWNWRTGEKLLTWEHTYPVDIVLSNHKSSVAFVSAYMDNGYLYDLQSGDIIATTDTQRNRISAARFSPNDEQIALGLFDGRVQLRDANNGELLQEWQAHIRPNVYREASHITDIAFPGGNTLIALGSNGLLNHFALGDTK
jgi:WD40 repeat protein